MQRSTIHGKGEVLRLKSIYTEKPPIPRPRTRHALRRLLERRLSDLVNAAYGLTLEEVTLPWETGPPRMPEMARCLTARRNDQMGWHRALHRRS